MAHDLETGLAMRPEYGAMYGAGAVSEQILLEAALERLPAGSTVMGDRNFGVLSVAWAAAQSGHPVLLRLKQFTSATPAMVAYNRLPQTHDVKTMWHWASRPVATRTSPATVRGRLRISVWGSRFLWWGRARNGSGDLLPPGPTSD